MTWWASVEASKDRLLIGAEVAISHAVQTAWHRNPKPDEPAIIAALVVDGTQSLGRFWGATLGALGIKCEVSSVFIHQSPIVRSSSGGCELGDLLIVHQHKTWDKRPFLRAILLQAKKHEAKGDILGLGSAAQVDLYDQWPRFTYATPRSLSGQARDSYPKHAHPGAQYLAIRPDHRFVPHGGLYVAPAAQSVQIVESRTLANVFVDLLLGRDGRVVSRPKAKSISWSQIVHDLLRVGAQRYFKCAKAGMSGQPAIEKFGVPLVAAYSPLSDEPLPNHGLGLLGDGDQPPQEVPEDTLDDGGASVIFISTSSEQ